jgi:hypothetical protein
MKKFLQTWAWSWICNKKKQEQEDCRTTEKSEAGCLWAEAPCKKMPVIPVNKGRWTKKE